jgi:hypothetical protein
MTHEYAKEIHQFIAEQISVAEKALQEAESAGDQNEKHYQEGKLKEFFALRKLLTESYDLSTQNYF